MPKTAKSNTLNAPQGAQFSPATVAQSAAIITAKSPANSNNGGAKEPAKTLSPIGEHRPDEQEVTLKYQSPDAREVKVAGNFNGWRPETALKKNGAGEWEGRLALRSGTYEYRFVVDGRWVEDPRAAHRGPNPFGGFNSILSVSPTARA